MIELPDLESLKPLVEWDAFIFEVLIPICLDHGWHVDFEFIEDLCCVIYGHFNQENPQDWQRFITDFIVPFSKEREWTVEIWSEEDAAILIQAPPSVKDPESETGIQQLDFFDLCPANPRQQNNNYQHERSY